MDDFLSEDSLRIVLNDPLRSVGLGKATESEINQGEVSNTDQGKVTLRKRRFQLGRVAAARALTEIGRKPEPIGTGPLGEPLWPRDTVGSITHSAGVALSIVAWSSQIRAVGLDLEQLRPVSEIEGLVAFGPEVDWLEASMDESERQRRLLELFSAKETIYKALSPLVGSYFGFEAARLSESGDGFFQVQLAASIGAVVEDGAIPGVNKHWFGESLVTWLLIPST